MSARWSDFDDFNDLGIGAFPEHCGLRFLDHGEGWLRSELTVDSRVMAPNGFLHAGAVVTLADTSCGYGVRTCAPEGSIGFTTVELKSNFVGTALDGVVSCDARLQHGGRSTQVWDATVTHGDRTIALFRCTQMILYPR